MFAVIGASCAAEGVAVLSDWDVYVAGMAAPWAGVLPGDVECGADAEGCEDGEGDGEDFDSVECHNFTYTILVRCGSGIVGSCVLVMPPWRP